MSGRQRPQNLSLLLIAISIAVLAACNPRVETSASASASASTDSSRSDTRSLSRAIRSIQGIECRPPMDGVDNCVTDAYDVSGSDAACTADEANFGSVLLEQGVDLLPSIHDGSRVAHLAPSQLVCIQYVAEPKDKGVDESWSYVTAIPSALVDGCVPGRCPEAPPVRWFDTQPKEDCERKSDGRYGAGCASGWVRSAALDAFSMGQVGQYAEPN